MSATTWSAIFALICAFSESDTAFGGKEMRTQTTRRCVAFKMGLIALEHVLERIGDLILVDY